MLTNSEARAEIRGAERIDRFAAHITNDVRRFAMSPPDRDELMFLAAERRKLRAEKARFGPHPMWRRLTGFTFPVEATLSRRARKRGLKRLVGWLEKQWRTTAKPSPLEGEGRRAEGTRGEGARLDRGPLSNAVPPDPSPGTHIRSCPSSPAR